MILDVKNRMIAITIVHDAKTPDFLLSCIIDEICSPKGEGFNLLYGNKTSYCLSFELLHVS